jgi:hypothetical protein
MKLKNLLVTCGLAWFLALPVASLGQPAVEKKNLRVDLSFHQQDDQLPFLKVNVKTKNGKRFEPVEGVVVNLFIGEETSSGFMGRVRSDQHGWASIQLPAKFKAQWDSASSATFLATVTSDEEFKDAGFEIEISKARIELELENKDSLRLMHAKLLAFENNEWVPVPDVEIKLVVRRLLSDLPAAEEDTYATDENGEVTTPFIANVPGDENGQIVVGAKLEDHEQFGNLLTTKQAIWGEPRISANNFAKRTLWATRDKTPVWLLVFPNLIIAGVWGAIFYLGYIITQIRKIGKSHT